MGAEVCCPNIFSLFCPENQVVMPEYYMSFARKWLFEENNLGGGGGGRNPLAPSPPCTHMEVEIHNCHSKNNIFTVCIEEWIK